MSTTPQQSTSFQPPEAINRQVQLLSRLDCFSTARSADLARLAPLCVMRMFPTGAEVMHEGAIGEFVYVVLSGALRLTLHDRNGSETLVGVLSRGDCFGEGPLFGDVFRGVTVASETVVHLLQIPLDEMRALLAAAPDLANGLRIVYRRRLVDRTLARVPLFSRLSPLDRAQIGQLLTHEHVPRNALLIRQGSPGDGLYLIESGQMAVERDGQAIAHVDEGDFVGEMSLLTGEPHNATIRAITPTEVLMLPAPSFTRLLADRPVIAELIHAVAAQRRAASTRTHHDALNPDQIAAVLEHGVLRGARLLVRDPELCVEGCRLCETACATRYGRARLQVSGVTLGALIVADTCRQCRVGAECVEVCPEDAIQWNQSGALVITDACTGCGKCVEACPYDAVTLVTRQQARQSNSPLWSLWQRLTRPRQPVIALEPIGQRADKCDLCHDHADLACVSACPNGALRLVPVEEIVPL